MSRQGFIADRETRWSELERLVAQKGSLGSREVLRLGTLYRSSTADLALARQRFPGDPLVAQLEGSVRRAHAVVYADRGRRVSALRFFSRTYWQLIAERPGTLLLATTLLLAPAVLAAVWATRDPGAATGLIPEMFRGVAGPAADGRQVLSPEDAAEFAAQLFVNNITVSLLAFAAGITFGLGTAFVLINNGMLLGAIAGLSIGAGNTRFFVDLVAAHGVLELSCIVVTAAAGMRIGWALVNPRDRPRGEAVLSEARRGVAIALGTMPWLVIAGIVESAVTAPLPGPIAGLVFGLGLGGLYWWLVWWRGRDAGSRSELITAELAPSL